MDKREKTLKRYSIIPSKNEILTAKSSLIEVRIKDKPCQEYP